MLARKQFDHLVGNIYRQSDGVETVWGPLQGALNRVLVGPILDVLVQFLSLIFPVNHHFVEPIVVGKQGNGISHYILRYARG